MIPGPAGDLESLLHIEADANHCVICCHPHPQYGGTMDNKVVHTLHRVFRDRGHNTVRFNFRGVGNSSGNYDNGVGESQDLIAVIHFIQQHFPGIQIVLAGFSFGSYISLNVSQTENPVLLVSVAVPVERFYFNDIHVTKIPWIVIQPLNDEVIDPQMTIDWYHQNAHKNSRLIEVPDCSHFFHGKLVELKTLLVNTLDAMELAV